jgi:adenylosuccinate synthase
VSNLAVIGAQWGDEGKAKIVDHLAAEAEIVARYQGGANAGHTVVTERGKFVFHLIPTGILRPGVVCVIGNGVVFDPVAFVQELDQLGGAGVDWAGRVLVSGRAHLVLPYHKQLDALSESHGGDAIGTTMRGIGPCYRTKAERRGILVADLTAPDRLRRKLSAVLDWLRHRFERAERKAPTVDEMMELCAAYRERVAPHIADTSAFLLSHLERGRSRILFEGAQGTMLDLDHGTYPYVTSSSTITGGIPSGLGIPPGAVHRAIGVAKGYTTRVGEGWFPTEDTGPAGEQMRSAGHEYGATTGRPRRCGWLDLVALRYAVRLNGLDSLAMTKLDVLDAFPAVRVCVSYRLGPHTLDAPPLHPEEMQLCEPVYHELPGWDAPLAGITDRRQLPGNVERLLEFVSRAVGVPVSLLSTGAGRTELIELGPTWG